MRNVFWWSTASGSMADLTGERDSDRDSLNDWMVVDQEETETLNEQEEQDEDEKVDPDTKDEERDTEEEKLEAEEEEDEEELTRRQYMLNLGERVEELKVEADTESLCSEGSYVGYEERVRRRRNEKAEATQDEESDLSLASCPSLPDNLPEIKPQAQYVHMRDQEFNSRLNTIFVFTLGIVISLAVGHFLGWSDRSLWDENLNAAQNIDHTIKENEELLSEIKRIQTQGVKPFKISGKDAKESRQLREGISMLINEIEEMRASVARLQLAKTPFVTKDDKDRFYPISKKNFEQRVTIAKLRHMSPELDELKQSFKLLKVEKEELARDYAQYRYREPVPVELQGIVDELHGLKHLVSEATKRPNPPSNVPFAKSYISFMSQIFSSFDKTYERGSDIFSQLIPKSSQISPTLEGKVRLGKAKLFEIRHSLAAKWDQVKSFSQPENIAASRVSILDKMHRVIVNVVNKLREIGQNTLIRRGQTPIEKTVSALAESMKGLSDQFDSTWSSLEGELKLTKLDREKIFRTFLAEDDGVEATDDQEAIEDSIDFETDMKLEEKKEQRQPRISADKIYNAMFLNEKEVIEKKVTSTIIEPAPKISEDLPKTSSNEKVNTRISSKHTPSSQAVPSSRRTTEDSRLPTRRSAKERKQEDSHPEEEGERRIHPARKERQTIQKDDLIERKMQIEKEPDEEPHDDVRDLSEEDQIDSHKINHLIKEEMKERLLEIKEAQRVRKVLEEKEAKEKEKERVFKRYEEHKRAKEPIKRKPSVQDESRFYKGQYNKYKHIQFDEDDEDFEDHEVDLEDVRFKQDFDDEEEEQQQEQELHQYQDDHEYDDDYKEESDGYSKNKGLRKHWEKPQKVKKGIFREHSGPQKQFIRRTGKQDKPGQKNSNSFYRKKGKKNDSGLISSWDHKRSKNRETHRKDSVHSNWKKHRTFNSAKRRFNKYDEQHHWWFDRAGSRKDQRRVRSGAAFNSPRNEWWFERVQRRRNLRETLSDVMDKYQLDPILKDGFEENWRRLKFVRVTDTDDDDGDDDDDDDDYDDGDEYLDGKEDSLHARHGTRRREYERSGKEDGREWVINQFDEVAKLRFG